MYGHVQAARDFSPLPTAYPGRPLDASKGTLPRQEGFSGEAGIFIVAGIITPSPTLASRRPPVDASPYVSAPPGADPDLATDLFLHNYQFFNVRILPILIFK